MGAICYTRLNAEEYVDPLLTVEAYKRTYGGMIHPLPDQVSWLEVNGPKIMPLDEVRKAGKPKKLRRREPHEPTLWQRRSSMLHCSFSNRSTHNISTCRLVPANARAQGNSRPYSGPGETSQDDAVRNQGNNISSV